MNMFVPFATGILEDQGKIEMCKKAAIFNLTIGTVGLIAKENWDSKYALAGNTFSVRDTLKANGARWNATVKVWQFESLAALETALAAL